MSGTFKPIELNKCKYDKSSRVEFVTELKNDLVEYRNARIVFYESVREKNDPNDLRRRMAILAFLATLFSAIAAGLRVSTATLVNLPPFLGISADKFDLVFFALALVAFAWLSALAVYEKVLDKSTAYFRNNTITGAIRDLWTPLEFEFFTELVKKEDGPVSDDDFDRLIKMASTFCEALNRLSNKELGDFRTEFIGSIAELDALAKKGLPGVTSNLEKAVKAHQDDAEKARKEAEEAAKKAEEAAKKAMEAAEAATKPGYLNVSVKGDFDGELAVKVNGKPHPATAGNNFSIGDLKKGVVHLEILAKKGQKTLSFNKYIDVSAGLEDIEAPLS